MVRKNKYPIIDDKKECGVCGKLKHISEFSKTRNYYSYCCKECKNIKSREYRKTERYKNLSKDYIKKYRSDPKVRDKINKNNRKRNKRSDVKIMRNKNRRDWTSKQKRKAIEYKGGKCYVCGYDKCQAALEFHHLDPSKKEGYNGGAINTQRVFEKNIKELDKCILICVRCHREVHANFIEIEL